MKFLNILVLSAAGVAMAKGKNRTVSVKSQCRQMQQLTQLTDLANNQTLLDAKTHNNATKADAIKAKAANATTELSTMMSNTTLMTACGQIFAVEDTMEDCSRMASMEKLSALVANQTALDAKTKNNATKADALKAKVSDEASSLSTLQSNTTLTAFCSVAKTQATCKNMASMQKEVDLAANTTALDAKFKGNATKIANFQDKAAKVKAKLDAMQSNTTLTDACTTLKSTTGASTSNNGVKASAADNLRPVAGTISLVAAIFAGVLLL